jgi:hypothetical protein
MRLEGFGIVPLQNYVFFKAHRNKVTVAMKLIPYVIYRSARLKPFPAACLPEEVFPKYG